MCLIPARGGSNGLPGKNIRGLRGHSEHPGLRENLPGVTRMDIKPISIEEFNNIMPISPQLMAIRAMELNTAIVMGHGTLSCRRGKKSYCSLAVILHYENKRATVRYVQRHLPDGNVAIACIPKVE